MRADRLDLYKQLEKKRNSKLLVYVTGTLALGSGMPGIAGFNGPLTLGSIGPNMACLVITILSAPKQIRVPELKQLDGIIISNCWQKLLIRFTKLHAANVSPPLVCRYNEILFVSPILSKCSENLDNTSLAI